MSERRRLPRGRCILGARVIFNNRRFTFDCTVRNRSEGGLLLSVPDEAFMPDRIELQFDNRAAILPAQVVWRSGGRAGVAFQGRVAG